MLNYDPAAGQGSNEFTPAYGDNSGSTDWTELLDVEALRFALGIEHEPLIERKIKLLAAFEAFQRDHAAGLHSPEDVATATDLGAQLKAQAKKIDDLRIVVKKPFYEADKAVQNFFMGLIEPLKTGFKSLEGKISVYNRDRALEAKKLAEDEARRQREEADRLSAQAIATNNPDIFDEATKQEENAHRAAAAAAGPVANFSRVRGDYSVSSGSVHYTVKIVDFALVPDEYKVFDAAKATKAVNGRNRLTDIPGCEIIEEFKTTIRS